MKKFFNHSKLVAVMAISLYFVSCGDDDEPTPLGDFASGVFVINEGNFLDGDGSVSFYNRDTREVDQTIFQSVNDVEALGDVIQSGYSHNGLTYLIANNSNKVEVVNSFTFESQFTMSDVELPRYMTVSGGKGYLTEWVSFVDPGKVSIFNLQTGAIEDEIEVGSLPEDIEIVGGKIYVTEAFSSPNLYIIDMDNNNEISTLTPGNGTNQLVVDANNNIWVGCGGGSNPDFSPLNDGKLVRINTENDMPDISIELNTNYSGKIDLNSGRDQLYYYIGNNVFAQNTSSSASAENALFTVSDSFGFYGIGVDPANDYILVSDANDFVQDGSVYVYSSSGEEVSSFTVGRIPNGFLFN